MASRRALLLAIAAALTAPAFAGPRRPGRKIDRLSGSEVEALNADWRRRVVQDGETVGAWRASNPSGLRFNQLDLAGLRARKEGGFARPPRRTADPSRRAGRDRLGRRPIHIDQLTDPEVDEMAADFEFHVGHGMLTEGEFLAARDLLPGDLPLLRARRPGGFAHLEPGVRRRYDILVMRKCWMDVEAGRMSELRFLEIFQRSQSGMVLLRLRYPGWFEPVEPRRAAPAGGRRPPPEYSAATVELAAGAVGRFQRGETDREVTMRSELRTLGIDDRGLRALRKGDPVRFASRREFRARNFDRIVDAVIAIARADRALIRSVGDVVERVHRDDAFVGKFGRIGAVGTRRPWLLAWDRARGGRLRGFLAGELGLPGLAPAEARRSPARPSPARAAVPTTSRLASGRLREMALELAAALRGQPASAGALAAAVAALTARSADFADARRVRRLFAVYAGVVPELARWHPGQVLSPRVIARWMQSAHEAGPAASRDQIARVFERSPEYRELGRLPDLGPDDRPRRGWAARWAARAPELIVAERTRERYQKARVLLEAVRTAPRGTALGEILARQTLGPTFGDDEALALRAGSTTRARLVELGIDPSLVDAVVASGWTGLGQPRDLAFDPDREPPAIDMALVGKLLELPRVPPLLEMALERLDARPVFGGHNLVLIQHLYSDADPFAEALLRAGMAPADAAFVSTEYPFDPAVAYSLRRRGITVHDDTLQVGIAAAVERGLRQALERRARNGKPILVLDDGGTAAEVIRSTFPDQVKAFKVVEITAGGLPAAEKVRHEVGRLPYPYRTTARSTTKRGLLSPVFARRVVDVAIRQIRSAGLELVASPRPDSTAKVVVLGGGAMGEPAGEELVRRGAELRAAGVRLVFVEPDREAARFLRIAGFTVERLEDALNDAALILGMATVTPGHESLRAEHMARLRDGAIVVQGASKRKQFDMPRIEALADEKRELRTGAARRSYTYRFGDRRIHFIGDGWTINHDGSLHGSPIEDVQLELALVFENLVLAARQGIHRAGPIGGISEQVQQLYVDAYDALRGAPAPADAGR